MSASEMPQGDLAIVLSPAAARVPPTRWGSCVPWGATCHSCVSPSSPGSRPAPSTPPSSPRARSPWGPPGRALHNIWHNLTVEDIFRVDLPFLSRNLMRWAAHLVAGGSSAAPEVRGLVDTSPLHGTLSRSAAVVDGEFVGIGRNVERGLLKAFAVTTLNYSNGQSVTWVQGEDTSWTDRQRRALPARITVEHIMASAALPIFFPAVRLGDAWHGDGGVRLSAPLAPALRLGATRILAISAEHRPHGSREERLALPALVSPGYPPLAQILSELLNSIFLDVLEQDVDRLEQTNELLSRIAPEERGDLRPVEILVLRPSEDLAALAATYEPRLPRAFRYLMRSLGTRETTNPDFLSYLMFQTDYLEHLMAVGERDAEARIEEVRRLVTDREPSYTLAS